jgi:hypothetical protein
MKRLALPSALLCCLLLAACDKFQYREQYVGDFDFTTLRTLPDSADHDSTVTPYQGHVTIWEKEQLLLRFLQDDSIAPTVAEDGTLDVEGFVISGGSFEGGFSDADHVRFSAEFLSFTGASVRYDVTGVRR